MKRLWKPADDNNGKFKKIQEATIEKGDFILTIKLCLVVV